MPFVAEPSSATAAQHESNHLYAELMQLLSKLQISSLPEHSIEEIDQVPPTVDTVDGEIVANVEKNQTLQLENSAATPILPEEELAERLRGGDDPQLLEAGPIRLLAPGDQLRLEVGAETIESNWATFPEALKQLSSQKVIDVRQALGQPENLALEQISSFGSSSDDLVEDVDPINLTVNDIPQFQRTQSGAIALNNLYGSVGSVQAKTAEYQTNQTATVQRQGVEASGRVIDPKTIDVEAVVLPMTLETISIPQGELLGATVDDAIEQSDLAASPLIIEPGSSQLQPLEEAELPSTGTSSIANPTLQNLQEVALETPEVETAIVPPATAIGKTYSLEAEPPESQLLVEAFPASFTKAESVAEETTDEPQNQLLPLGEIERVTGQEIGAGPLHNQVLLQAPSMIAYRNASGQFTATQTNKAHVEATTDEVETEVIIQAEHQEEQPMNGGLPMQCLDLSPGNQSVFSHLDSFLQQNRHLIDGAISDRDSGIAIQPQDGGGFVATVDRGVLNFDGKQATGDSSLIAGVSELAQKTIEMALAYNAQAAQKCEDNERA